jgi:hypothetical protein
LTKRREKVALAVETHESWLEANRSLNMDDLKEQKSSCSKPPHDQPHGRPFCRI